MKKASNMKGSMLLVLAIFLYSISWAQGDRNNRPSPPDTASGTINGAHIKIYYSSPAVKGRQIWGTLVPYSKAWRAGANEATIFETDKQIKVEGKNLPAGRYSLFATPEEKEWAMHFNSETGQWGIKRTGEANRDPAKDVLSVPAKAEKSKTMNERLKYQVNDKGFVLRWENIEVPVKIK